MLQACKMHALLKAVARIPAKVSQVTAIRSVTTAKSAPGIVDKHMTIELDDGRTLKGISFGAEKPISGELVFSTAMVGYPESLTDPSYRGQILVLTHPLVGNYGVPSDKEVDRFGIPTHFESNKIQVAGLVVADYAPEYSHWTATRSLSEWLKEHKIPAISGIDTRELTKICRERGTVLGRILPEGVTASSVPMDNPNLRNLVSEVSCKEPKTYNRGGDVKIVAVDCGIKNNIVRMLAEQGAEVKVVPWDHDLASESYDGLFISNGPGDPSRAQTLIANVKRALDGDRPIFGICMGNQILGMAAGLSTYKMKYGNRGHNQPAVNQQTGACLITSQNHGFALDAKGLPAGWEQYFVNANDGTNEGLVHSTKPFSSVQFHPEATGGPRDSTYLFGDFVSTVRAAKTKAALEILTGKHESAHKVASSAAAIKKASKSNASTKAPRKVLVLGSGGLSIGQAGEFDYSGSQCIKALKEEGVETILLNPNIATIQTGRDLADTVYFLPVDPAYVRHVVEKERPDGILLTFGGQTALNTGIRCEQAGVFADNGVRVLGTPIQTLITSEDRDLFARALGEIDQPVAHSVAAETVSDALKAAEHVGYPVIIRSAFALGGLGSGFAENESELRALATKSLSLAPQILVERSMKGWKEVEYEVVRDAENNCITVCNMENFDPLGIHTGESIVVAPSQTLTDHEYHMLREAAIKIIRHLGVVGECNVQYALNPATSEYCVIEVNARLSRSSALASKATGYPLAFVAAKIALGHSLPQLRNSVTRETTACFEPSLDYCVVKIPRWDLGKFNHVSREIGSSMKSVGEVMSIGRTFEEAMQKAIRMVDPSVDGFQPKRFADTDHVLRKPTDQRVFAIADAMFNKGYSVDKIHDMTKIDKWFLHKLDRIVSVDAQLKSCGVIGAVPNDLLKEAKIRGFSDRQIAKAASSNEMDVRSSRKARGIVPFVKQIDTLAGEFPARTNYLYTTYNASSHDVSFGDKGIMVLGSGVYRIGSSVEFDWCGVGCIRSLRASGRKTIMVNYNPETVSTDYDECDRLYFEELSVERVLDIYDLEDCAGVIASMGGQTPQNMAMALHGAGVRLMGTSPLMVDAAEDRVKFSSLLDRIGIKQPAWAMLTSLEEAVAFSHRVSYPVLVRPSYVLSGAAMSVARSDAELNKCLSAAADVSPLHPVIITKFMEGAREIDVDGVAANGKLIAHAVSEHVEDAGVHSGDATLVLPSRDLTRDQLKEAKRIAEKVAAGLEITGPFNMQLLAKDGHISVIECNLRASRSFPFVSKTLGIDFIELATRAIVGDAVSAVDPMEKELPYQCVKVPQFSFTRLGGADPMLGVEMASTGEVACFGRDKHEAYLKALLSTNGFRLPKRAVMIGADALTNGAELVHVASQLRARGLKLYADDLAANAIQAASLPVTRLSIADGIDDVREKIVAGNIDMVLNLAAARAETRDDANYRLRRLAVDHGVPLITNAKCAVLFSDAFANASDDALAHPDVVSWSEYLEMGQPQTKKVASVAA
eukprot:Opistho-2@53146